MQLFMRDIIKPCFESRGLMECFSGWDLRLTNKYDYLFLLTGLPSRDRSPVIIAFGVGGQP